MSDTQEPWERRGVVLFFDNDGDICTLAKFENKEDAERAEACVNACKGIETETLNAPGSIAEIIHSYRGINKDLRAQLASERAKREYARPCLAGVSRLRAELDACGYVAKVGALRAKLQKLREQTVEARRWVETAQETLHPDRDIPCDDQAWHQLDRARATLDLCHESEEDRVWKLDRYRPRVGMMAEGVSVHAPNLEAAIAKAHSMYTAPDATALRESDIKDDSYLWGAGRHQRVAGIWFRIVDNKIVDRDQYRHDLESRANALLRSEPRKEEPAK